MSVSRPDLYGERILSLLFSGPGLSRADLADRLGIDRGNLTRIVRDLLDRGLLLEGEPETGEPGAAGRRRVPLRLNDGELCILGAEVQKNGISVSGFSPYGRMLSSGHYPFGRLGQGGKTAQAGESLSGSISRALLSEIEKTKAQGSRILGAGVGISGLVDPLEGRILYSIDLDVTGEPLELQSFLEKKLGLPVAVDNDARCCCYDVMTYGAFSNRKDFLYLFCEIEKDPADPLLFSRFAIGSALVLEGRVRHGVHSTAGEFRSIFTPPEIPGQFALSSDKEIKKLRSDTPGRNRVLEELSRNLGFLANYLDLEAVFLGGGIEAYRDELEPLLKDAIRSSWLYQGRYPKPVDIHFAASGDKPALRGAAALMAGRLFL
jgi:predicted NBD/HSP70 family sugar kinase